MFTPISPSRSLLAGVAAAIGASLCCVALLVLLSLGIGGAWIGNLTVLEPYRPIFVGVTGTRRQCLALAGITAESSRSCS